MQSLLQCHLLSSLPKKPPLSLWSSTTTTTSCIVYAGNKDSSSSSSSSSQSPQEEYGFDFDKDKARQALKALDQQLDTMYEKQASSPKFRVVEDNDDLAGTEEMAEQEMPDFSGSFVPYFSLFLIVFTIFYNVLFYTVIKPAVDGPSEPVMASASAPANISTQTLDEPVLQSPLPEEAPQ